MKIKITIEVAAGEDIAVEEIECDSIIDGLHKLHERLNQVANPRQYESVSPYVTHTDNPLGKYDTICTHNYDETPNISC